MSNVLTIRQRIALEAFANVEIMLAQHTSYEGSYGGVERQLAVWEAAHEIIVPDIEKHDIPLCDVVYKYGAELGELIASSLIQDDSLPSDVVIMALSRELAMELIEEWK